MPEGPTPIEDPKPARVPSRNTLVTVVSFVVVVTLIVVGSVVSNRSKLSHPVVAVLPSPSPSPSETPVAPATSVACTNGWHVEPMPVVEGDYVDELVAISALATDDVWAVGIRFVTQQTNDAPTQALFEHWDGRQWTIVPTADDKDGARLTAIAMDSSNDGWAVGKYPDWAQPSKGPLVEHWDGTRWSVAAGLPRARGEQASEPLSLFAVRAFSPTDVWVVGRYSPVEQGESVSRDVFEHWDGHAWAVVPWPVVLSHYVDVVSSAMQGVSGRSSTDLWAAGGYLSGSGERGAAAGAVIEHWNGASWRRVMPPDGPAPLTNLAEVSPHELWGLRGGDFDVAFGGYGGFSPPQILHWDGQNWSVALQLSGEDTKFVSIVALTRNDAWAVGTKSGQPLIEHWNGTSWSVPRNGNGHFAAPSLFAYPPSVDTTEPGDVVVLSSEPLQSSPQNRLWFRCGSGA